MATVVDHSPAHSPPAPDAQRPRGILKNSYQKSPPPPAPASPQRERSMSSKEVTIANTQVNAGPRRSSSGHRPPGSRRQSGVNNEDSAESSQRLKWDEANLYLTEQERTSTMKITEPKTPYAKHYDPAEDPSDDEDPLADAGAGRKSSRPGAEDDIPGLSLGDPEDEVAEAQASAAEASRSGSGSEKSVHVDESVPPSVEDELAGLSPEEREKHRKFEEMRKKHYEMKNVAQLLGHPETLPEDEEDDDDEPPAVPPVPSIPNGTS